jgi:hypothetical protein
MNLDDLNKQLFALQNDFKQPPQSNTLQSINPQSNNLQYKPLETKSVNFQDIQSPIETTQIKRPTKSGDHRSDINDKMNSMNTFQYLPQDIMKNPPNTMPEFTRNYSTIQNQQPQQPSQNQLQRQQAQLQQAQLQAQKQQSQLQAQKQQVQRQQPQQQPLQNQLQRPPQPQQPNQFANYYNHNFDTLQNNYQSQQAQQAQLQQSQQAQQAQQMPQILSQIDLSDHMIDSNLFSKTTQDTHSGGLPMLNPRNMYNMGQYEEVPNKYNDTGFHKIEEKKIDYRQSMNSKLDGFVFDNPNAGEPNPILQQSNNLNKYGQTKDTRMVIQDSNKDYYRQSANDRMSHYSPLSRASNMPINMASMSVNDFYSNMGGSSDSQLFAKLQQEPEPTLKDSMNSRISNYEPLAKTIQYQTQSVPQLQKAK